MTVDRPDLDYSALPDTTPLSEQLRQSVRELADQLQQILEDGEVG